MEEEDIKIFNVSFDALSRNSVKFPSLNKPRYSSFNKSYQFPYKGSPIHNKTSTASTTRKLRNHSLGFTPKLKHLVTVVPASSLKKSPQQTHAKLYLSDSELIDWKTSPLETCVITNHFEFNWEQESSLLSEYQVQAMQIKDLGHGQIAKGCLRNTVKRLCLDLMMNNSTVDMMSDSQLLKYCKNLIKIRKSTLNLITRIHEREHIMLRLITDSTCNKIDMQTKFMEATFQVISHIKAWKKLRISASRFIYDGQNYMKKIHNDLIFLESSLNLNSLK